ncbi:PREDICTED: uncharacterized protein LOC108570285 [Habropoda laboriosa]|uniref:uncharacterized protein LOC108570285 n=1 Tax=Habropoda laboriosa TaxID=597456 RepID=UPI00083E2735|nr:PREDICTED: uncharacterized protein LOC108570285 [Habropoda laboriosa]
MNGIVERNASGKSWMAIAMVFWLFHLTGIVTAQPGYDRLTNDNTIGIYDSLLSFAKVGQNDVAGQVNEEISGTIKERHKRLSDQRRAELETLMALSKMTGKMVNVMRGGRQLQEATRSGRKKRSVFDLNVKNLQKLFRLSAKLGYKGTAEYPVVS